MVAAAAAHYDDIGIRVPSLLLPTEGTDLTKWCVIACDQYTSQPKYWNNVEEFVGDAPSALNLIFPEVYLGQGRDDEIISGISTKMQEYEKSGILEPKEPGLVMIDRKTPVVESRKGLLVEIDLELYSFAKGSQSLVRATEKTIEDRLPPRVAIRKEASVELPHILVLIDDPNKTVIEPLFAEKEKHELIYDFDLMEGAGHLTGHHVKCPDAIDRVAQALRKLADPNSFRAKYGAQEEDGVLLFPVGDGNHSLATAKRCWEDLKANGASADHPARFALVELENIHDDGLEFEPIHRLLLNVGEAEKLVESFVEKVKSEGHEVKVGSELAFPCEDKNVHALKFRFGAQDSTVVYIEAPKYVLEAATLTAWLDPWLAAHSKAVVDYVHGTETIDDHCAASPENVGILIPSMHKNDLVKTVVQEGVLPRKTFSMGEADEKRFYFESRRIVA